MCPANLIFDLDGTLVDSLPGIEGSLRAALTLRQPDRRLAEGRLRPLVGPPLAEIIASLWPDLDASEVGGLVAAYRTHYLAEGCRQATPFAGVAAGLREWSQCGLRLFVLTNKPRAQTDRILGRLGWQAYFQAVSCPDDEQHPFTSKADGAVGLRDRHGLNPAATWLVGDAPDDACAAAAAGFPFLWASYGYGRVDGKASRRLAAFFGPPILASMPIGELERRGMHPQRTVLLTGGSRGIGHAVAEALRAEGHAVLAPGRGDLDLASPASIQHYAQALERPPDVLINNAGWNKVSPLETLSLEDWQTVVNVNLTAPFLLIQAVSGVMKERGWGRIVNISSCYSLVSRAGRIAYSASKSGLNGLTRTAALELAPHNILVNAICPGFVETDMTHQNNDATQIAALCAQVPIGRLAQPREVAALVAFLVSERNTYLTGQVIPIDGGFLCQ